MSGRGLWAIMAICMSQYPLSVRAAEPVQPAAPASPPAANQQPAAAQPPTAAKAPAPTPTFPILEYQVEGNTRLRPIDIERAVTPYLGENKTLKDVEAARGELERVYRDHGYKTVQVNIPPQKVGDGVVRLSVLEGRVGKLKIAGSKYHSLAVIRDKAAELNPDKVPDFNEVQKELGQLNRSPDMQVQPLLRASDTPGRFD